jgi:hypothetical protein
VYFLGSVKVVWGLTSRLLKDFFSLLECRLQVSEVVEHPGVKMAGERPAKYRQEIQQVSQRALLVASCPSRSMRSLRTFKRKRSHGHRKRKAAVWPNTS